MSAFRTGFSQKFSGSDRGSTKSASKQDLVCLKGSSLGEWSRQVKDFNLSRPLITLKEYNEYRFPKKT